MKGMVLIKSSQETDVRTLNRVFFIQHDWIIIDTIEYRWKIDLMLKTKGIIITDKFIIISLMCILLTT